MKVFILIEDEMLGGASIVGVYLNYESALDAAGENSRIEEHFVKDEQSQGW